MRAPLDPALQESLSSWGVQIDPHDHFGTSITALHTSPPLLRIENFLTPSECAALIRLQQRATEESDLYLNYRVNRQVQSSSHSAEAEALLHTSGSTAAVDAGERSGFRAQVAAEAVELEPVLRRVRELFGWDGRAFVFAEGPWRRASRRAVVVRDQTTVRYGVGEGVAPHVDGKDATVLVCLKRPEVGGKTVFPEVGVSVEQREGVALVYWSGKGLLHYGERVGEGEKWVLQLLIDFRVRADEMDVDFGSGQVFT